MSELKPCPLCGSEVGWVSGSIRCSRCGLSYRPPVSMDKEKVERRWNTRAERTCIREKHGVKMDGSPRLRCSLCGYGIGDKRWKHCPNCGARVEDEK